MSKNSPSEFFCYQIFLLWTSVRSIAHSLGLHSLQHRGLHISVDTRQKNMFYMVPDMTRVVIKSQGVGNSPSYYECGPWLRLLKYRGKIEPKEISSSLFPYLLVVFPRQHEILATTLHDVFCCQTFEL